MRAKYRKIGLLVSATAVCVLAGWNPHNYFITAVQAATPPTLPTAFAIPSNPVAAQDAGLGYLPASGSVGADGQYTYAIPIEVLAGRAGLAPTLSLNYSSRAAAGFLGEGWSLSGLS